MSETTGTPEQSEVRRLQEQVADLQRQLESAQPAPREKRHWVRTFWATLLIVVACLLAPLSMVSVWARGEVTDTDRYIATVAPLAQDPAIQQAVANRITEEIFKHVDVPALTSEAVAAISANRDLTPQQSAALQALTGPLNQGIQSYTQDAVDKVVQSPQFAAAWVEANTLVHERLNAALTGQNTDRALQVQNNQVVLDLGNLVAQVKQRLIDRGFTIAERIPTTNATIVLFDVPNATAIQNGYNLLNTIGFWLPLIAVALAVLGVFISHTPSKALAWFGFGLMLAMVVAAGLLAFGRTSYLNALPDTVNVGAATAFFDQFTMFLRQSMWAGAAAGLVLLLGGLSMGSNRVASGVRALPVNAAAAIQRWLDGLGLHMAGVRTWVCAQAGGLRIAAALAALVFVMLQRYKTPGLILWTTVGLLVALFVVQILASGVAEERTDGSGEPPAVPAA